MGSVSMKAWAFVLFCFTCTSIEATQQDSCAIGMKTLAAKMDKLHADIKAIAHGLNLLNPQVSSYASCKDIYQSRRSRGNRAYVLQTDIGKVPVYCHMTSIGACGSGGWTLVMKIDGHKPTFHYDSHYWTNKADYNRLGGKTGFDAHETKLPTYWSTPFSKICLAMKIGHQIRSIVINRNANSLYSLISDGKYRSTTLGRGTWKSLIGSQASVQRNCNREGFNVVPDRSDHSKARIGIMANQENDCTSCDSRIGFGTGGVEDDSNTCGNQATHSSDNGDKHIKAMGYIMVQ
ncbi:hypothetical protein ACROYT_G029268 [Oculina patagonica]